MEITEYHADGDCDGNIYYDPDALASRALLIQRIIFPPFRDINPERSGRGPVAYLHIFPSISFTEDGSVFQWRFAARINTNNAMPALEGLPQYPSLQIWREDDEQSFNLIASTEFTSDPALELGTLNLYSYDGLNLTYQAGNFIAVYQPPVESSKYLLAFVDSSNYAEPRQGFERILTVSSVESAAVLINLQTVEPLINIRSTSMPDDNYDKIITMSNNPFATASSTSRTTVTVADSEEDQGTGSSIIPVSIGVVAGVLFVTVSALVITLCFTRWQCKKTVQKKHESGSTVQGKEPGMCKLGPPLIHTLKFLL